MDQLTDQKFVHSHERLFRFYFKSGFILLIEFV